MPWPKGRHRDKTPGSGRQPGASTTRLGPVGEHARDLLERPDLWDTWLQQAMAGTLPIQLLLRLMDYAWGKPVEMVEQVGEPMVLQIIQTRRVLPMQVPAPAPAADDSSSDPDGSQETKSRAPSVSLAGQRNIRKRKTA